MNPMPVVEPEKCNGCGLCVNVCYCDAVILIDNVATVMESTLCGWCTLCEMVCPTGAISCPFEIVFE